MNFVFLIFTFFCVCIVQCINPSSAGGTADTGNARVAAVIFSSDGTPAVRVPVILTKKEYLAAINSQAPVWRGDIQFLSTDDSGHVVIDSLDSGDYVIEVNDTSGSAVCLRFSISAATDSTTKLYGVMKSYASIGGNAGPLEDKTQKRFLLIYGLNRCVPVGDDGVFVVKDLPEGEFDLKIISDVKKWEPVEIEDVAAVSNKTVQLPAAGWHYHKVIHINTTVAGAAIEDTLKQFPLLVRLSADNFSFSSARGNGKDIRFISLDSSVLSHEIEYWDSTKQQAFIWVLLDRINGNYSGPALYMQWGNNNASLFTDSSKVFSDTYLTCFHFNGSVENSLKNSFAAIDSGSIHDAEGVVAGARRFDGANSFLYVKGLPERKSGSISFWFKPARTFNNQAEKTQGIWGKKISDSINYTITLQGKEFYPVEGNVGKLITKMEDPDTGYYQTSKMTSFTANTWYHVLWAWGDSTEELYINGALENQILNSRSMSGLGNDEIGRSGYDYNNVPNAEIRYFNGSLDEFRMDSTQRSAAWAKFSYMNQHADQNVVLIPK
ncbi:MAG: DUF2341 domain-containing protein [Chitinispirillaceae bacterium]|nr:DUF2341 domain-containing protein [Chitinispirillaceae bacterium]